ncbi:MAG TPA: Hsp20/alpha crystallin family protein [Terriglobia bacterium]|nr:Hsp20/alpha crystallin family protein [Terriglobia bacterium]
MAEKDVKISEKQNPQSSVQKSSRRWDFDPFAIQLALNPFVMMRRMMFDDFERLAGDVWMPAVEISVRDDNWVVMAELAGLQPQDVSVEVQDGTLVIEGERKVETSDDNGAMHRTERRYGRFFRSIPLPEGAQIEQARAKIENGILEVKVPVKEKLSDPRRIPVETAA